MKTLHRRCAGLDVHSDSVVACARLTVRTKASHEVRRFSTATRDPLELAVRGFDAGQPVDFIRLDRHRGLEQEAAEIDDPLLRLMGRLQPHFEVVRAVRFAHEGDK